jgi:NitT/TauT family transport system substrate-binding protein
MKRLATLIVATWASFGCQQERTPAVAEVRPKLDVVRVNRIAMTSFGPLFLAKAAGDFEREGIDLSLLDADFGTLPMALASNELDVVASSPRTGFFNLMAKGAPIRVVADRGHAEPGTCSANAFGAQPPVARRIRQDGFRGQRFYVSRGGTMEHLIHVLLERHRLTPREVEFLPLPGEAAFGKVDGVVYLPEPMLSGSIARDGLEIIAPVEDLAPGYPFGVIFFGKRMLENRDLGVRFMRAYLRGVARYREGKTDRNVEVLSRDTRLPQEILRRACWETIAADGMVNLEAMSDYLRWARANGYIDADVPPSTWWDPSFIERTAGTNGMEAGAR